MDNEIGNPILDNEKAYPNDLIINDVNLSLKWKKVMFMYMNIPISYALEHPKFQVLSQILFKSDLE
jgi:hypothetical protein